MERLGLTRRATLSMLAIGLAACGDVVTLEETAPLRTIDVTLPDGVTSVFLENMRTYAQSSDFSFVARRDVMPGSGEAIVFEMLRADIRIFGRNRADRVSDESPPGMIGPTIAYSPSEFVVSVFPHEQTPTPRAVELVVAGIEAVVRDAGGRADLT